MAVLSKALLMSKLSSRLPVGGLFLFFIALGMILFELNSESYVRSLCLALMGVNGINLIVYPFNQTLNRLRKNPKLNQWQKKWLSWQLVNMLILAFIIDVIT